MERIIGAAIGTFIAWAIVIVLAVMFWVYPQYRVWQQDKAGQARLAEAKWSRQIAVEEAEARKNSATLDAAAEVERAKGVAEANQIIGDSLQGNEAYLRYLWIQSLTHGGNDVIYVPTEANLPVLEAGRLNQ